MDVEGIRPLRRVEYDSEPEPDLMVSPLDDYDTAHPDEAYLLIEVSESSLSKDRGIKRRIYAERGVPEYWIVNLVDRCVEVYTEPQGDGYRTLVTYERGQSIRLARFEDVEVRVSDVMK